MPTSVALAEYRSLVVEHEAHAPFRTKSFCSEQSFPGDALVCAIRGEKILDYCNYQVGSIDGVPCHSSNGDGTTPSFPG